MSNEPAKKSADTSNEPAGDKGNKGEGLIFGKYKTMEDAQAAHTEAERKMHEATAEAARYKDSLESVLADPAPKPNDQSNKNTDDESVNFETEPDETFAQRFMENPKKYLRAVRDQARREGARDAAQYNELYTATREFIGGFLDGNPDIKANPKLFALHLQATNPKEKLGARLDNAAKATRDEIARIKDDVRKAKDFQNKQKDKAGSVEGEGDTTDADNAPPKGDDKEKAGSFEDYMKERRNQHAKFTGGVV